MLYKVRHLYVKQKGRGGGVSQRRTSKACSSFVHIYSFIFVSTCLLTHTLFLTYKLLTSSPTSSARTPRRDRSHLITTEESTKDLVASEGNRPSGWSLSLRSFPSSSSSPPKLQRLARIFRLISTDPASDLFIVDITPGAQIQDATMR